MGPHGPLLRVGERLRESLQGAARRPTDIKEDISLGGQRGSEPTMTMRRRESLRDEDTLSVSDRGEAALMERSEFVPLHGMTESGRIVRGKIYAVARGRQIGLFDTWEEVKPLVEGVSDCGASL